MKSKCFLYFTIAMVTMLASVTSFSDDLPFDKIFTTSEQRSSLDEIRAQRNIKGLSQKSDDLNTKEKVIIAKRPKRLAVPEKVVESKKISLSGFIVRSDGKQKVWLNGKELNTEESLDAMVSTKGKRDVILTSGGKKISLKVGQKWLEKNDTIIETYKSRDNKANE